MAPPEDAPDAPDLPDLPGYGYKLINDVEGHGARLFGFGLDADAPDEAAQHVLMIEMDESTTRVVIEVGEFGGVEMVPAVAFAFGQALCHVAMMAQENTAGTN